MKIRAYAKVNLALDVVRKREDGYHDLEMIMAPITLHDLIYIEKIDHGIQITANTNRMPTDQRNIMYKVAQLLIERYQIPYGVKIHIYKHIPTQAGLAGGSGDGAAVLKAMNQIFQLNLSLETLADIGKEVGADIPFCIYEKTALVKGIGEKLEFISRDFHCYVLLVKPKKGVSTKKSFGMLDLKNAEHPPIMDMKEAIENNDYQGVVKCLGNTLEEPSLKIVPDILKIKEEMKELGFDGALMSGSGSCVFGLTQDQELLEKGYQFFLNRYAFVRKTEILNKDSLKL
ncbi:4-(cytidine 5'-diphospho)-2-C-methyl-D-erythritol kinase [Massilimicrobiota sp. SW1139]|uniref:4-(cytidine 5'-diphospho)-2-C-methyl-D-erythritol kinase n=1 Tax=Massilimicrobiota sp. SW1139 TaxID=2530043 RepID=UPI00143A9A45|nr:4-(cytidine 5'-diphospho)-2-C-methyl-D-erythritol kinase [Massilimicrobiota sp. SW1139]NJE44387.1 4-(cytidine 5'-diphospho)-2-C-methyl-D-erythritol kinase [Massilimicrobiota sp. SW1139]